MEYKELPPIGFVETVNANTRSFYFSDRFREAFHIVQIMVSFAPNTQRTLQLRFWVTSLSVLGYDLQPSGIPLLSGGTREYIVGDTEEGRPFPINKDFPGGNRIMVDANNVDGNVHTLDATIIVRDIVRGR